MIVMGKKATAYILAMLMVIGTISVNFSAKAYATAPPVHEITASGAFSFSQQGKFNRPNSVTADVYGNVYVADSGNNRIQKFDSSGNYVTQWGSYGSANGQFNNPTGIAVDTAGNVYVADSGNNRIQKFDSDGTYVTKWGRSGDGYGEFDELAGIAVDTDGNVYAVDPGNSRIQKFKFNPVTSTYVFDMLWGGYGSGNGQFISPNVIAVDAAGSVYVVDYEPVMGTFRIQKFNFNALNSTYDSVTQWGGLENTSGIALDTAGNVYVVDRVNARIRKLNSSGTSVTQWGSMGSEDGQFSFPSGITVDANGSVYVVDTGNNRIQKFNSSGTYLMQWGSYGVTSISPSSIAVSNSGNVYAEDLGNSRILKFDSNGTYLAQWGSSGNGDGQFFYYGGKIASDAAGNVFVVDYGNNRVQKFDSNGTYLTKWGSMGSENGKFNNPTGIAVDTAGNVYVVDTGNNRIQKFDSSGTYLTQWGSMGSENGKFNNPTGIAVDTDGNVYVVDTGALDTGVLDTVNYRIQKFDSSGTYLTQWGSYGGDSGQFDDPQGIAVDAFGNVYVADTNNSRIQKFDSSGNYLTQWGSGYGIDNPPKGVSVDKDGIIYVAGTRTKIFSPNNNTNVKKLTLSVGLSSVSLNPSFTTETTSYTATVASNVAVMTITPVLEDPLATVSINAPSGTVTSSVYNGVTSYDVPLNGGENTITLTVTAYDRITTKNYTVSVTRLPALTSTIGTVSAGGTANETITNIPYGTTLANFKAAITPTANATFEVYDADGTTVATTLATGKKVIVTAQDGTTKVTYTVTVNAPPSSTTTPTTPIDFPVISTDGTLTLPAGKKGEVSLEDAVTISIPANATNKELKLTIDKVLDTQNLLKDKETLASPIFEILKNFPENFSNPVTLTFTFDPTSLKGNQKPVVFYYDEEKREWVKVGGEVKGNKITVDVNHFTKYAVMAVDQADKPTTEDPAANVAFSDISGHWAEANIKQAISNGMVSGYPDGTFKPNHTVTRAEFAVMLMNALGQQGDGASLTFTDKAKIGAWAQKAVAQAVKAGIINGYEDGSFRPNAVITRSEMAVMITKALGQSTEATSVTGFADDKDIPAWAKGAVAAMKELGLVEGKGSNAYAPGDQTTRAEAVTVLLKMLAYKDK
ncbi:S-layer homology domain-containing protein [Cohnella candidum]|nr:S-layer homology domain-containing protein [Cohnella candidum]